MIQKCRACDYIWNVEVAYEVTDDGVVFTLNDPCCRFRDCKMVRSIIGKALCVFLNDNPEAVDMGADAPASYSDCCCKIPGYPNMTWYFGLGQAHWGVVTTLAAGDEGTVEVPVPFVDVV